MTSRFGRIFKKAVPLCFVASMLSGCAALNSEIFQESFWASSPFKVNDQAELGLAEMAKGNYVTAEGHFQKALKANSRDITCAARIGHIISEYRSARTLA